MPHLTKPGSPDALDGAHFLPWTGTAYSSSTLGAKRVLVLGESHYDDKPEYDTPTLTREIVGRVSDGSQRIPFFTKVARLIATASGEPEATGTRIWDSLAFYNYIPGLAAAAARVRPTDAMWRAGAAPFEAVLHALDPHRVLVLGVEVWNHLMIPKSDVAGLDPDGAIRRWRNGDGRERLATWIPHPSSVGFSTADWDDRVRRLLDAPLPRGGE